MTSLTSSMLVSDYGCEQRGNDTVCEFSGIAPLSHARSDQLSFFTNERYLDEALKSTAGGILCSARAAELLSGRVSGVLFVCKEPYVVFARVSQYFHKPVHGFSGQSPQAYVDASATVHPSAVLFPFAFVGPGAVVGARSVIYPHSFVGAGARVGDDCILYPSSVLREGCSLGDRCIINPGAVIGGDGFGFAPSGMENVKIPQIGGVRIEDDVEVGANSSIDRAAFDNTVIGRQTKLDSLVQIGHNVVIGQACFLAGQVGVAGSTVIGNRVTLAGQVGVVGHIKIGDNVTVFAQSGVSKDTPSNGVYGGSPARPHREYLVQLAAVSKLAASSRKKKSSEEGDNK